MAQRPCNCNFAGSASVARADLAKALDEFKIFCQSRLAEFRIAAAKIVGGQCRSAFAGHGSSEQTRSHWRIGNHADSLLLAVRKDLGFNLPSNDGVGRLQRSDRSNLLGALDLRRVEIRNADPADFAFGFQGGECLPGFFNPGFAVVRGPVHLIKTDGVDLQAAKAGFAFAANGFGSEFLPNFSLVIPDQNTLRENVRARAAPFFQGASDDFFGVAQTVHSGSVNPVDAQLQRAMNGGDGIGVVLRAPGKFPPRTTESPGAKTYGRNFEIGVP